MSKEYYKKRIVDLRDKIAREKEAKKKDNEYYARLVRCATGSGKATYRKQKMDHSASHARNIEYYKREIENLKRSMSRC